MYVLASVPLPDEDPLRQTTFICSAEVREKCGPSNAMAQLSGGEDRVNVRLDQVPDSLVNAVIAAEDRDFFDHGGVDPIGIARALVSDLRNRSARQGGSTITQQYVKNYYLSSERTVTRKLKEAVLAVKLERELSKEEILERYLNTIYLGRGAYGVQAASRAYFGKDVAKLALHESAYLAGLIRAPESADAIRFPEEASRRRSTVLDAMLEEGYIDKDAHDAAEVVPWDTVVRKRPQREGLGVVKGAQIGTEYFVEHIRKYLSATYGDDVVYGGGLRVYTSLDMRMQAAAWQAIQSTLDQSGDPEAALVAVDDLGFVRAMVGGRDFEKSEVNLAVGKQGGGSGRQAGSAFKPFVLTEAVRQGVSMRSRFQAPGLMVFPNANNGEDWRVRNYEGTEQGVLDLVEATRVSSNTVYAQLMLEVGPKRVVETANRMGIESDLPAVNSLVLGTGEVSPLEMAGAYSTLARRGVQIDPAMIVRIERVDEDGNVTVLEDHTPDPERVLSETESDVVTTLLRGVIRDGTGAGANIGRDAAGKTGTTQSYRDAWFVGYTPKLTAAVWMGYVGAPGEEIPPMDSVHGRQVTGGSFPADIWREFMFEALEGIDSGSFPTVKDFRGELLNPELSTTTSSSSSTTTSTTKKPKGKPTSTTSSTSTTSTTSSTSTTTTTTTKPQGNG